MVIEIVNLPIKNGGSFHSYVTVYQRVPRYMVILHSSWLTIDNSGYEAIINGYITHIKNYYPL